MMSLGSLFGARSGYLTAMGHSWHPACFVCAACGQPLGGSLGGSAAFVVSQQDGRPYHPRCHKAHFHPRCCVCSEHVPQQASARPPARRCRTQSPARRAHGAARAVPA